MHIQSNVARRYVGGGDLVVTIITTVHDCPHPANGHSSSDDFSKCMLIINILRVPCTVVRVSLYEMKYENGYELESTLTNVLMCSYLPLLPPLLLFRRGFFFLVREMPYSPGK